jgi:hypothetical protein
MAKPIRSTPELKGESADKFLIKMVNMEKSKITKADKNLSEEIKENSPYFVIC